MSSLGFACSLASSCMLQLSWEAQLYVDKGESAFFFRLVSSESSKNQIIDFWLAVHVRERNCQEGTPMGSERGARCVPYWTVLYAKSSLGDCPEKEYITGRNSYVPLENLKIKNLLLQN